MAHFAKIDKNNYVTEIIVISDNEIDNASNYIKNTLGLNGRWIQTSYNNSIRGTYAGIGYLYDEESDKFIYPEKEYINEPLDGELYE